MHGSKYFKSSWYGEGKGKRIDKSIELTCDKEYPNEPHRTLEYEQSIKYNSLNKALIYSMKGENIYG